MITTRSLPLVISFYAFSFGWLSPAIIFDLFYVGEEPNHTTGGKPSLPEIIEYSLVDIVRLS
jgi:hypothetical protein